MYIGKLSNRSYVISKELLNRGLFLCPASLDSLSAYNDTDWASYPDTHYSTTAICIFLSTNVVSLATKKKHTVSCNSTEFKYWALSTVITKVCLFNSLLNDLSPQLPIEIVYDNLSTIYVIGNLIQHAHTKHIEVNLHFFCERDT